MTTAHIMTETLFNWLKSSQNKNESWNFHLSSLVCWYLALMQSSSSLLF